NGLNNITDYYWRVRAKNEIGYGSYSTWFKFTTIVPVPAVPSLVSPSNGATGQSLTTDLTWNGVQYATNYRVQVATDAGFTNLVLNDSTVTDTTETVSGLNTFTQYYWRVLAKNINGSGSYSAVWSFTTIVNAPAAPVLVAPANNSTGIELTPTMDWDSVSFAETFRLVIASDTAFNNVVLDTAGVNVSQFTVPSGVLANSIKYYWRVNASSAGGSGNFSVVWNFTTAVLPPSAPVLTSPLNNSVGQSFTPLLEWDSLASANSYTVQLSEDSTFATTLINETGLTLAEYQVASGVLDDDTKYYWRVSGTNSAGTGAYSDIWNFTTLGVGINTIAGVIPKEYKLFNNYPNPFNPSTKIKFDIPKASFVTLKIYDMSGREIAKLVDGNLTASSYEFTFNAGSLPSGVYFYRLQTNEFVNTMRMVLVK
ncbi:MAG TPA: T9SS type A sorting domain-containing protein, partial [Ignavibacteria bacterium]|nr:T9SS type A sorting domain-containing protein [Ignavibacteria bacterium]